MNDLPQALAKDLFDLLCEHQTLRAVLVVRRELSLGLKDALAVVNKVRTDYFRRIESPGMSIAIFGVGPLQDAVADYLDYDRSKYKEVSPGTPICVQPFELDAAPVEVVHRFCAALGVGDVSDLNQHALDNTAIDFEQLVAASVDRWGCDQQEAEEELEPLKVLAQHGFRLFLRIEDWETTAQDLIPKEDLPWD